MSIFSSIWSDLKVSAGAAIPGIATSAANSIPSRFIKSEGSNLIYKNNRAYDNVIIHVAKQKAAQAVENEVNNLIPKYKKYKEKIERDKVLEAVESQNKELIKEREQVVESLGVVNATGGGKYIAKDKYGNKVPEALMLYYDGEQEIAVTDKTSTQNVQGITTGVQHNNFKTKTVCFIDLAATVSIQSSKNLVLTQVQGRDYTRKELISGGDLSFSVSGKIVGNEPDLYPENDVKKFIQIMQYGGIIKVNQLLFKQFNIGQIIIKDYNMGTSNCKNVQPYSFNCVAVEPDEDVEVKKDTINTINRAIERGSTDSWFQVILENQLNSIAGNVVSGAAMGLDALTPTF